MWRFEQTLPSFNGFNLSTLKIDEVLLNISSSLNAPVWLYTLSDDCYSCAYQRFVENPILPGQSYSAVANARHGTTIRFRTVGNSSYATATDDRFKLCDLRGDFGEFGVYSIHVQEQASVTSNANIFAGTNCVLKTELEPVDIYSPILFILMFWIFIAMLCSVLWKNWTTIIKQASSMFTKLMNVQFMRHEEGLRVELHEGEVQHSTTSATDEPLIAPSSSTSNVTRKRIKKRVRTKVGKKDSTEVRPSSASQGHNDNAQAVPSPIHTIPSQRDSIQHRDQRQDKERLKALDAFRGLCIIIMIFVDDGGGGYYFLQHSTWDGLYVADLAFPWFLWICGVCIPFSIHSRRAAGMSKCSAFGEILKRSLKLIILGIMVNTSTRSAPVQLENLRLPGVLQRFGVCYFVGSLLFLLFYKGGDVHQSESNAPCTTPAANLNPTWRYHFQDVFTTMIPWIFVMFCTLFYTVVIFVMPVPGCPTAYLGPAGLHENSSYAPNCVGGATGYVDRLIFGINHIHNRPTSREVYGSGAFDPEGILGILPSILHVWIGVQTGTTLLLHKTVLTRVCRFGLWSVVLGLTGIILCGGYRNQGWIPINKNLWSLSFVCVTSAAALLVLTMLYLLIDVRNCWSGRPLVDIGMNSIMLYLGHEVCHAMVPWHFAYGSMHTHASKFIESSWGTFLWILVSVYTFERKLFFVV